MIFKIIMTTILFIALICTMYGVFEGVRENDDKLTVLCGIASGLIGFLLGLSLSSIMFNF